MHPCVEAVLVYDKLYFLVEIIPMFLTKLNVTSFNRSLMIEISKYI